MQHWSERIKRRGPGFLLYLEAKCDDSDCRAQRAMKYVRAGASIDCLAVKRAFEDFEAWFSSGEDAELHNRVMRAELENSFGT